MWSLVDEEIEDSVVPRLISGLVVLWFMCSPRFCYVQYMWIDQIICGQRNIFAASKCCVMNNMFNSSILGLIFFMLCLIAVDHFYITSRYNASLQFTLHAFASVCIYINSLCFQIATTFLSKRVSIELLAIHKTG